MYSLSRMYVCRYNRHFFIYNIYICVQVRPSDPLGARCNALYAHAGLDGSHPLQGQRPTATLGRPKRRRAAPAHPGGKACQLGSPSSLHTARPAAAQDGGIAPSRRAQVRTGGRRCVRGWCTYGAARMRAGSRSAQSSCPGEAMIGAARGCTNGTLRASRSRGRRSRRRSRTS